jgi:hypothetical protein
MKVVYAGTSDFREFSAADFKKGGFEDQKKLVFEPGVVVEVDDELGAALVGDEGLFGPEPFEEVGEDEEGVDPRTVASNTFEADLEPAGTQESTGAGTSGTAGGTAGATGGRARGGTTRGGGARGGSTR